VGEHIDPSGVEPAQRPAPVPNDLGAQVDGERDRGRVGLARADCQRFQRASREDGQERRPDTGIVQADEGRRRRGRLAPREAEC
jgi:hypothetical protein